MFIKKEIITVDQAEKIEKAIKPIAEKYGQEVVEVVITSNSNGVMIKISVGSKKGPMVSDLASITKEFRKLCESSDEELVPFDYLLEVSSPGIERELTTFRDFYWNEDRFLKLVVKGEEKNTHVEGKLVKAYEDKLVMLINDTENEIKREDILKAKIKIKF